MSPTLGPYQPTRRAPRAVATHHLPGLRIVHYKGILAREDVGAVYDSVRVVAVRCEGTSVAARSQFYRTPNLAFPPACCAPLAPPPPWPHAPSSGRGSPAESRASTPPPASRARPPPGGYPCAHIAVRHTRPSSAAPDHTPSTADPDHFWLRARGLCSLP
eukprot:scaffold47912_cov73-Phaeocystis_antarctica.AAC.6